MVDWELTATTIYCQSVGDEVTLLVSADGTCRCTGRQKYARPDNKTAAPPKLTGPGCPPAECEIILRYRQELLGEEGAAR
jgi:hypothetical protein